MNFEGLGLQVHIQLISIMTSLDTVTPVSNHSIQLAFSLGQ